MVEDPVVRVSRGARRMVARMSDVKPRPDRNYGSLAIGLVLAVVVPWLILFVGSMLGGIGSVELLLWAVITLLALIAVSVVWLRQNR
jgi:hypothetical protein